MSSTTTSYCNGEFIQTVNSHVPSQPDPRHLSPTYPRGSNPDLSSFNPVIVLPAFEQTGFQLYHQDRTGSGLQPLPSPVLEILVGSGFDRMLDQLSHIDVIGFYEHDHVNVHPPASKAAVDSMPVVIITDVHVSMGLNCAVCKEAFDVGYDQGREMPCKHIYHADCILPWLKLHNTCPVCRYELVSDTVTDSDNVEQNEEQVLSSSTGLSIWRLPGGGFMVGRFSGDRREVVPLANVFTEMDGGFVNGLGTSRTRRIVESRSNGSGFRQAFRNMFSFLRRSRRRRSGENSGGGLMNRSGSLVLGRMTSRRNASLM